ncbi:hypothetical protein E2605_14530 [Dysgonomonas capnocytophagoides]|uniref:Uncharacterized protein n=1 Tax=Dysgonomonas capnocytophagoides TaxID=45254 RepID=A0A4Y8KXT2_9BACT|nr:hypothetical protein [Dysgonomonas capnocytophagoides]TFD95032.1 hypothetical protein E2605_14530 [Dysgonomonas capnocytophagoides]
MNKTKLLVYLLFVAGLISCSKESPYEIRSLYIEYNNIPADIQKMIEQQVENKKDTVFNFAKTSEKKQYIIYRFYSASQLPKENLLDGTRKIRLSVLNEKDSIGNPLYQVELYKSEQSQWKRTWNLGSTSFYSDTIVSDKYIGQALISSLNISDWKGLP